MRVRQTETHLKNKLELESQEEKPVGTFFSTFLVATGILLALVGIAAGVGLFLWAIGVWHPGPVIRVLLIIFFIGDTWYYLKTRPAQQAVYAYVGLGLVILILRWFLGK